MIDADNDGQVTFYDFGSFMQVAYIYTRYDKFHKGRLSAGDLYEYFYNYGNFPVISFRYRERARRFNLLPKDLMVDMMNTILMFRVDDIMKTAVRRSDKDTIYEFEMKNAFSQMNFRSVPDRILNKCLRGTDAQNIPLYDWECAFINSLTGVLKYYDYCYAFQMTYAKNLTLTNTVFMNVDPNLMNGNSTNGTSTTTTATTTTRRR